MSQQYDNTNRGALFPNDRKEKDTHPDLKGSINIDGKEYWISGWDKQDRNGNDLISLSVTPKEQQGGNNRQAPTQSRQNTTQHRQSTPGRNQNPRQEDGFDPAPF